MTSNAQAPPVQLEGVAAALASATPVRTALSQFSLVNRVGLVTGGASREPDEGWLKVQAYAAELPPLEGNYRGRLEFISGDVTDQAGIWEIAEEIATKEGRLDICFANAGILRGAECLDYPAEDFRKLIDVNVNGVLFAAQAAGRQMERFGIKGSIILTASMSGSIANQNQHWVAYNTSKSAVLQMARSMACELGVKGIRVNSLSPGYIYTQ
ncbi:hypothetical protein C0991_006273 [Blastosporella zonata]|nr:hypothetical protein C0991_006273 [Blastosporella zonata]